MKFSIGSYQMLIIHRSVVNICVYVVAHIFLCELLFLSILAF